MMVYNFLFYCIAIAMLLSYCNYRFVGLHATIAMMSSAIIISLVILLVDALGFNHIAHALMDNVKHINFNFLLMNCLLSFLLFAGALNIKLNHMKKQKWEIAILSTVTTVATAFLVAWLMQWVLSAVGVHLAFVYCMLFGALIAPTDPIAVLAIIRKLKASQCLEVKLAGESLFNDGVGIVLFITTLTVAFSSQSYSTSDVLTLFFKEAVGGIVYGAILGFLAGRLIRSVDSRSISVFVTLIVTTGAYALANKIGISGPLAMVVAGILVGNGAFYNDSIQSDVVKFWEIVDEILNALLFLLIGLEMITIHYNTQMLLVSLAAIFIVLLARWITVAIPMAFFKLNKSYFPNVILILTWGGLRGGLAVALALSIPKGWVHDIIIQLTFTVVVFSILVQGTTVKKLVAISKRHFDSRAG